MDFNFDLQYPKSLIENFYVCDDIDACLDHLQRSENSDMAVGGSKLQILNSQAYSPSKHYCFDDSEAILTYQVSLLLKKNSKMEMQINRIIRYAFEAGLFVKWGENYKNKYEEELLVPAGHMTMANALTAVVLALGVGVPLSFVVFFLEIITSAMVKRSNPSKYWLTLHKFLCPKRLYFKLNRR